MKLSVNPKYLPVCTLGAGLAGFLLRLWLFSARDAKGLLPAAHFADTVCYLIFAAALVWILLCVRQLPNKMHYHHIFPTGWIPAAGCCVGAAGILYTCIADAVAKTAFSGLGLVTGILAAAALAVTGLIRFRGNRPSVYLLAVLTVYLVIHTLIQVRVWSQETQATVMFFPLMASLFLMVCVYYHSRLTVRPTGLRQYVFFQQATLLLCCLSLNSAYPVFYLAMGAWLGCDLYAIPQKRPRKEAA